MILPILLAVTASTAHAAPAAAKPEPAKASAPAALPQPAIAPKSETACGVMVAGADAKAPNTYKVVAGLKLLGNTGGLAIPKGLGKIRAVKCSRDTVVPAEGDGRPLFELNVPLLISDGSRTAVLQIQTKPSEDKKKTAIFYTYGLMEKDAKLSDEEKKSVSERLAILDRNLGPVLKARQAAIQKAKAEAAAKEKAGAADAPIAKKQ
jgi:hypothetical protein